MPQHAYAFFFVAVLIGSGFMLWRAVLKSLQDLIVALRGEVPERLAREPLAPDHFSVWHRPAPVAQPVVFSICRI